MAVQDTIPPQVAEEIINVASNVKDLPTLITWTVVVSTGIILLVLTIAGVAVRQLIKRDEKGRESLVEAWKDANNAWKASGEKSMEVAEEARRAVQESQKAVEEIRKDTRERVSSMEDRMGDQFRALEARITKNEQSVHYLKGLNNGKTE